MAVRDPNMGMNTSMWNVVQAGDTSKLQVDADKLKQQKVKKVRIGGTLPVFSNATQAVKDTALFYKSQGFYVIVGLIGDNLSHSNIATHEAAMDAFALWCYQNGIDEFMMGNEELKHLGDLTEDEYIAFLRYKGAQYKILYPNLVLNYAIVADKIQKWIDAGLQIGVEIDRPSINIYGSSWDDVDNFEQQFLLAKNAWGDATYISEWGPFWNWDQVTGSEIEVAMVVWERLKRIMAAGLEHMFFTWKFHNTNDAHNWNKFALWVTTGTPTNPREEWVRRQMYHVLFNDPYRTNFPVENTTPAFLNLNVL